LAAAAEAETRGWKISIDKNLWYLDQLKQKGMQILPPSAKMVSEFRTVGDALMADWLKAAGPDGQAVMDAFRKM
jgi:TRAP-type C4-dicarboxylate transport system substrate-binding protein